MFVEVVVCTCLPKINSQQISKFLSIFWRKCAILCSKIRRRSPSAPGTTAPDQQIFQLWNCVFQLKQEVKLLLKSPTAVFTSFLSAWVVKSIWPVRSSAHQVPAKETAGKWIMLRWWAAVHLPVDSQSLFVCSGEWKEGENSIKAQRCIFHSTNKDKQKPEHVGLCFVSAGGSLCVHWYQTAVKDLKNNFCLICWAWQ